MNVMKFLTEKKKYYIMSQVHKSILRSWKLFIYCQYQETISNLKVKQHQQNEITGHTVWLPGDLWEMQCINSESVAPKRQGYTQK